ncbi:MAG TPA: phage tail tape measure protein [Polyangiaceae bacterium]|nr:phage tail tape measure protein [Polyangiaceae bacterium]
MAILSYDIRVVGKESVDRAFSSIEARLRAHNRTVSQMTGGKSRVTASPRALLDTAARDHSKLLERGQREEIRIKNAINALNIRDIKREERARLSMVKAEGREREKIARVESQHIRQRSRFVQSTVGHGLTRVGGTVKAVGAAGAAMVGVSGAALAANAVSSATKLDEMSRRLAISARQGGTVSKFAPEDLRKQFETTGIETGINAEDIAGGVQAFVTKTGDLDTAIKNMRTFATVAQATGASVEDVASASADLSEKLGISSVEDMQKALATLTMQGKKGAFELKDMAGQFPRIAAAAAAFGIKGTGGLAQLGGFLQVARSATGSGEQAGFATEATFRQLTAKSAKIQSGEAFEGRGVQVFQGGDAKKGLRDFNEILGDVMQASRGDMVQLQETFGEEGIRAIRPLIASFREASQGAGGGAKGAKAGRAAVMSKLTDAANVSGDWSEIQKDSAEAMKSFSVQMGVVNARLKEAIASKLFPEIVKLVPEIAKLVPYVAEATRMFVDLAKALAENPLKGLGAIIALQFGAEIAKAKLSEVITREIAKSFAPGRPPVPGAPGAPGSAPQLSPSSPAAGILSKMLPGAQLVQEATEKLQKDITGHYGGQVTSEIERANALKETLMGGGATPETRAEAAKKLGSLQGMATAGEASQAERGGLLGGLTTDLKATWADLFGAGGEQRKVEEGKAAAENLAALQEAAKSLQAAMDGSATKLDAAAGKLGAAGDKMAANTANRSDKPSGIKP